VDLDRLRGWAPRILGGIRLFNGAAALVAPGFVTRRLGADPDANPAPIYPLRMFGVRTVVIGADLLLPAETHERLRAMRIAILIHASDTLAAGLGGLRGQLAPRTSAMLTGISALNTALAIVGSCAPRRAKARRRWLSGGGRHRLSW
jgi:hypothetical protein